MSGFMKPMAIVSVSALTLALSSTLLGGAAMAQSSDQIISALKPGNAVSGSTRGIKFGAGAPTQVATSSRPVSAPVSAPTPMHRPPVAHNTTPVHTAVSVPEPVAGPSVNLTVNFPTGSADLTPAARTSLDALGKALSSNDLASFRFRIEGHTDSVGSREENLSLSQRRAEAVVYYLTSQYRVDQARLEAVGMGQEHPLIDTAPQTPEAKNRRVQVINLGA